MGQMLRVLVFKTNQVRLNVLGDEIRIQSFSTDYNDSAAV